MFRWVVRCAVGWLVKVVGWLEVVGMVGSLGMIGSLGMDRWFVGMVGSLGMFVRWGQLVRWVEWLVSWLKMDG